jgi:hypothetical protein
MNLQGALGPTSKPEPTKTLEVRTWKRTCKLGVSGHEPAGSLCRSVFEAVVSSCHWVPHLRRLNFEPHQCFSSSWQAAKPRTTLPTLSASSFQSWSCHAELVLAKLWTICNLELHMKTSWRYSPHLISCSPFGVFLSVSVCVKHLNRRKTCTTYTDTWWTFSSTCWPFENLMKFIVAGGWWISFHLLPNEDGGLRLSYRDFSSRRTRKAFHFLDMGSG